MPEDATPTFPSADGTPPVAARSTASFDDTDNGPAPPEPPSGYELLEVVGRGGMGVVYGARDTRLNRTVAVKFLRSCYAAAGPEAQRFVQEAQITGQLQHPGVPPVHEVGALADGRPFLIMKLVRGRTLQTILREREPNAPSSADRGRLLAIFEQVCQTVGYAHEHGVIHRDLKPSNVMVGKFGEVQVMDWGLAKSLSDPTPEPVAPVRPPAGTVIKSGRDSDSATKSGSVLGTPAYMPPEQAGGEVAKIDARSDVFGLGAVLCAILTGEPPYVADDEAALCLMAIRGQLSGAIARLDACGGDPELVALCKRCLAPEREDRPRDANEVAEAVARLRTAAEERARTAELDRVRLDARHREQRQRRRVRYVVAVALAILLVVGAAGAWRTDRHRAALREADLRGQLADEQLAAERRERLGRNAGTVAELLTRCEQALRDDDAPTAKLVLEQAEQRAAEGGSEHLADRLARCRADLNLVLDLEEYDPRWTVVGGSLHADRPAAEQLLAALARYGIVPAPAPSERTVGRVRDSLVRAHILTALDRCLEASREPDVRALLRAVDPDEFRDTMRDAVAAGDLHRVDQLAERPEALAQPVRYTVVLGDTVAISRVRRTRLLLAAIERRPSDYRLLMTLGYLRLLDAPGAGAEYERWFRAAVAVRPRSPVAHNYLGLALLNKKELPAAVSAFREAIRLDERYGSARNNLGAALQSQGDADGAIAVFRSAVRYSPTASLANRNLARLLAETGDFEGAARSYAEWLRHVPDNPVALNGFAWLLASAPDGRVRDGRKAVELATRACELSAWKEGNYIDTLAAALAEAGDFGRAVAEQKRALSFPEFERTAGAVARKRLALYERNQPYRTPVRLPVAPRPHEK
jgi:eukaryotic-like serine/threonine-protein kinase